MASPIPLTKVLLVGDCEVGKTAFVTRHRTGVFVGKYKATENVQITPLSFYTNHGKMTVEIWDHSGTCIKTGIKSDGYDAAIVMFDLTNRTSFKSVSMWISMIRMQFPEIHIIVCGNKGDCKAKRAAYIILQALVRETNGVYHDISTKSNLSIDSPFISIARKRIGKDIKFVEK